MKYPEPDIKIDRLLQEGTVIPAHPLALTKDLQLDEQRQRRLTQYYIASGAGGVAVGVHTTQFKIRDPAVNLLEPVLRMAAEEIKKAALERLRGPGWPFIKVAGIVGPTDQAIREAKLAVRYGYDLGLLSMGGLKDLSETELVERARTIAGIIPLFGFYLQPAVGGRLLSYDFWREFAEIPNVCAIKVAAFNRYQTLDVVRAVCQSSRRDKIALYTGNDDNIVADLLTPYRFVIDGKQVEKKFVGGLLGHWAVWTNAAVKLLSEIRSGESDRQQIQDLLSKGVNVTDMNAAIFDAKNSFHGCIPGIHEILRRQGLLEGTWCLNPNEKLSPGQLEEIDRVCRNYPGYVDDSFVSNFLRQQIE
ncbi:MAG TPA: dihydrodipicolinate synthase family protein [Cyclobacteriaceae bacterium]|nr:dihydrodipicolinate synthase family protein [Cyclobacteriaceae bacterium]